MSYSDAVRKRVRFLSEIVMDLFEEFGDEIVFMIYGKDIIINWEVVDCYIFCRSSELTEENTYQLYKALKRKKIERREMEEHAALAPKAQPDYNMNQVN